MECEECGAALPDGATVCPACGASVPESFANDADGSPTDGAPAGGDQPGAADAQPADDVPSGGHGGEAGGEQPASAGGGAAATGDAPQAQPQAAGAPGQAAGQRGHPGGQGGIGDTLTAEARELPLKLGAVLGAVALLIPYLLVAIPTIYAVDQKALDVATGLFFLVVEFGSGETVVDVFTTAAGVAGPEGLTPSNHPSLEQELSGLREILLSNPDVPFLLFYLVFPWVAFLSGRYLARHYAVDDSVLAHCKAGASVAAGTLLVTLGVGLVFGVGDLAGRVLGTGLVVPAAIGAVGGLTVFAWDDYSALASSVYGWAATAVGIAAAYFLLKWPGSAMDGQAGEMLGLDALEKLVLSMSGWLSSMQFDTGYTSNATLISVIVLVAVVAAGFLLVWRGRHDIADAQEGARAGSSVVLGLLGPVAIVAWLSQIGIIFVTLGFGAGLPVQNAIGTFDDYVNVLLVAGVVAPAVLGAAGGYAAIWYRDRDAAQPAQQGQPQNVD